MQKPDKKALRKSLYGSLSRVIGVALGSGAGTILHNFFGDGMSSIGLASVMALLSFGFMWVAEYERERD